ncbi:MAG: hypothetical protein BWY63_02154 [Chloroflexi bacterium ADurb.Bin360]|nr:MAG: hypothetical protein BWY63_02154 [Chloroflexi bacterium ADurb.Bin360]
MEKVGCQHPGEFRGASSPPLKMMTRRLLGLFGTEEQFAQRQFVEFRHVVPR